jgi:hypothetical protein
MNCSPHRVIGRTCDALAILLALALPERFEVRAIIAVAGNVPVGQTAANIKRITELAGRPDLPVYAGCAAPMVLPLVTAEFACGPDGLAGADLPPPATPLVAGHGVAALLDLLRAAPPGGLTVCALGPLTNIAMALRLVGAVQLGIHDATDLRDAIARIETNVRASVPGAVIDGFELQEELVDCIETMVGFKATPPFGALMMVGTGGTMVELQADRALGLSPVRVDEAAGMIHRTRMGALLAGYRKLIPATDTATLAKLISSVSELAADLCDVIVECDLNPVLIQKGSSDARVVDALFVVAR